MIIKLNNARK